MNSFYPIAFVGMMILAFIGFALHQDLLRYLKNRHREAWGNLGKPSLFSNNSIRTNLSFFNFLKNKKYLALNDIVLNRKSSIFLMFSCAYLTLFLIVLVTFLIALGMQEIPVLKK